jgi:CRISPR-associated endonuclease Csn1
LFEENKIDIEHTIPRSISFDDSLSNLTVCYADFNRHVKKKQIPSQLTNHAEILQRIKPWIEKVEHLEERINHWKEESKKATTKDRKDECIRQRHLWEMEYEYWKKKVDAFTIKEVSEGFRNNQLNDTRTITKYAYHYLKTVFNKVDVQKGKITAEFRKIVGVQSVDEKKDRSKHSHHAIDATILTLIPNAEKREKLLKLFYQKEEDETNKALYETELKKILKSFVPKDSTTIKDYIESNILVNHISKDQALTPARRRKRIRGKIVPILDKDGKKILETNEDGSLKRDKYGRPIPKAKQWIKGDSIRGELHKDTFYGAITRNKDFENPIYVVRRELKHKKNEQDTGFKNWEELGKVIVNKDLIKMMKEQFPENTDFKTAVEQGIYMLDKNRNKVNQIRHVRCEVPSVKNPLEIKDQTYKSDKEHKNKYYAAVPNESYAMSKYESGDKKIKNYLVWNLFDISENRKVLSNDIPLKDNNGLKLVHTLIVGTILLVYNKNVEELYNMNKEQLQQRLYVVRGFWKDKRIILQKTINAEKDPKTENVKSFDNMPEMIRQSVNKLNYLIKGKDFDLIGGEIVFLNKK